jgi:hypothetical protein
MVLTVVAAVLKGPSVVVGIIVVLVVRLTSEVGFSSGSESDENEKLNWSLTEGQDFLKAQMYQEHVRMK